MSRPAFTVAEMLVAVVVFSVGILGLTAMGTVLVRQVGEATALTHAATLTGTVLDSLRATPCGAVGGGTRRRGAATVRWAVSPSGPVVAVSTLISIVGRQPPLQFTIETLLPCDR